MFRQEVFLSAKMLERECYYCLHAQSLLFMKSYFGMSVKHTFIFLLRSPLNTFGFALGPSWM